MITDALHIHITFQVPLTMYLSGNNFYCKETYPQLLFQNKLLFRLICTDQTSLDSICNSLLSLPLCELPTLPSLEQKDPIQSRLMVSILSTLSHLLCPFTFGSTAGNLKFFIK